MLMMAPRGSQNIFYYYIFFCLIFVFKKKKLLIGSIADLQVSWGPRYKSGFTGVNSQETDSLIFIILIFFFQKTVWIRMPKIGIHSTSCLKAVKIVRPHGCPTLTKPDSTKAVLSNSIFVRTWYSVISRIYSFESLLWHLPPRSIFHFKIQFKVKIF